MQDKTCVNAKGKMKRSGDIVAISWTNIAIVVFPDVEQLFSNLKRKRLSLDFDKMRKVEKEVTWESLSLLSIILFLERAVSVMAYLFWGTNTLLWVSLARQDNYRLIKSDENIFIQPYPWQSCNGFCQFEFSSTMLWDFGDRKRFHIFTSPPPAIFPRIQSGGSRPAHLLVKSTLPLPSSLYPTFE